MDRPLESASGYCSRAYADREKGYSPTPIRDAVWSLVEQQLGGTVLDAGSGEGGWIKCLKRSKTIERIVSVDLVQSGAHELEGVEFHQADLSYAHLPFSENEFDWIFALEVIEHLANPRNFITESFRCLRSGGRLVVTTPCNESIRARLSFFMRGYFPAFGEHDYRLSGHITALTEVDFQRMGQEAGFREVKFHYPLPGRIPKTSISWQSPFPFLAGKLWSDSLFVMMTK
jgi:ubiquinone/menaquinone biosynthesis C-methylase UbiE